ncbi:hypothetical protein ACIBIZ_20275 [Nonomuraea spiralis]|uniref:hypothetical protein n=1 Tax=Nonomuraea spiralis TaxID=46182 RepID=UPI00378D7C6C
MRRAASRSLTGTAVAAAALCLTVVPGTAARATAARSACDPSLVAPSGSLIGDGTLVRVYQQGQNIVFKWSGLGRDWDWFNVRWSKDAGKATQVRKARLTPWSGQYVMAPYVQGGVGSTTNGHEVNKFAFIVQGCDRAAFGSDCGPWSIPTSISLAH